MSQRSEQLKLYFDYLDELRESGKTNMFGASPYLADEFSIPIQEARSVLALWTKTFNGTDTPRARAIAAVAFESRTP